MDKGKLTTMATLVSKTAYNNFGLIFEIGTQRGQNFMAYNDYKCKKCGSDFHYQVPRGFLLKSVFSFLPIRIYWCPKCTTNRYVWVGEKS